MLIFSVIFSKIKLKTEITERTERKATPKKKGDKQMNVCLLIDFQRFSLQTEINIHLR